MPKISDKKRERISEQIIHYLYTVSPDPKFTSQISQEIARDEEFTKSILLNLKKKKILIEVNKNKAGTDYKRRQRWLLSNQVYNIYKSRQNTHIL